MSINQLHRPRPQPAGFERACADDIQSEKPPAAMMMTRSPKPASVQIFTFLGECRHRKVRSGNTTLIQIKHTRKIAEIRAGQGTLRAH
jgi:hypothetical protein